MMSNAAKSLATSLSVPHNYFDDPTKLFLDPAKFLDTSFFSRTTTENKFCQKYRFENNFVWTIKVRILKLLKC